MLVPLPTGAALLSFGVFLCRWVMSDCLLPFTCDDELVRDCGLVGGMLY